MTRAPLRGADLYDWIVLRRVSAGGVAKLGDWWLEYGRRMPGYVTDALPELCQRELVALSDPDPTAGGLARAALTHPGTNRYEQLCRQRQSALQMAAVQFAAACAPRMGTQLSPQFCHIRCLVKHADVPDATNRK